MMKVRSFLYIFVGLLVLSGCSKDTTDEPEPVQSHEFKLRKYSITTEYRAGHENIYLDTDMTITWTAVSSADWLTVSPSSGTGGANIVVNWQENTAVSDREATVTFSAPERKGLTLTVKQSQKPAELVSTRAILGNVIKGEKDSVELVFDSPIGALNISSNSELYYIDDQAEKMDDEGLRWRLPLKVSKLGNDIQLLVVYRSASDWVEHKKGVTVPFYQKKYLLL